MRILAALFIIALLAVGTGAWYVHAANAVPTEFRTSKVVRGDLVSTIAATGTLEPEEVVDVGAQVTGLILSFGNDVNGKLIDYRSPVKKGQVLAKIDDTTYQSDVKTTEAQIDEGKANVLKAKADLATAQAKLTEAENNWNRAQSIGASGALTKNDYDMYKADYETAKASVGVAEAEIAQAETQIAQAQAANEKAKRNLSYCTIYSPVDGEIIDRRVNVGQTVVSSLNTSSMFLIAKDLKRMQIWVAVNEADIGRIHAGTPVTFTCDAFPDRTFRGSVNKVRLNATMAQNVVMYTVEVNTDNSKDILLPYLTANVKFEVQREPNVLLVPNAALRWYPSSAEQVVADARETWHPVEAEATSFTSSRNRGGGGGGGASAGTSGSGSAQASGGGRGGGGARHHSRGDAAGGDSATTRPIERERTATIWVKEGEFARPLEVKLGATDGINTAVFADNLPEGAEVITGEVERSAQDAERNPFLPQMHRRH